MHEFLAKIGRFAVSKAAAFCYAVTVGVSGQLAYNYLQPKDPAPAAVAAPAPAAATLAAPIQSPAPASPRPVSAPAAPLKPAPGSPAATAPILPEPPPASLPSPASLPPPALKPTALPRIEPSEAAKPDLAAKPDPLPSDTTAATPVPPLQGTVVVGDVAAPLSGGPIPLLPPAAAAAVPETEKAPTQVRPGPGSGGLY